ncbi:His-Xaa-Ser system radical SAM maturase HxsC [Candidatus Woesebacteria bacterium RBG_16_34_12]|uniref:His-Xaa-Ser system radical SAM maturase HxsC n=1 Tax=Candidatus Woesebacteria bacterium RBG_16_34_12 TaxID=1802480 RepID=A0A1F7X8K9_9BACT|nr:MAG: His-Xaa-Ser system radical SAM maturase HxsC [Candidatus Woesebacteria bacterium RBG_16_34_12]
MLTLQGIPVNVQKPLLGKIDTSSVNKNERQSIIVNPKLSKRELKNYEAILFSSENIDKKIELLKIPTIYKIDGIHILDDADVVEILPDGRITVLYKKKSPHNIIFVTSKCNSNCIMCPQPINYAEGNLTDLNLKLISLIDKSTNELALTGGEPTIAGKDLLQLILACKNLLPDTSLLLLTNARKFGDFNYTHLLSSILHPNLTIGTALYGDNDRQHDGIVGAKGAFNETVMGILNLASFGNQIEIRTVIFRHTYKNLLHIAEFIYRNMTFVKHIAFMGLETIHQGKQNLDSLWVPPYEMISYLEEAIHYLTQRVMNTSIYNIPLCLLPESLWKFARQSISDWKRSFDAKCQFCSVRENCSGMFDSTIDLFRNYLKPI